MQSDTTSEPGRRGEDELVRLYLAEIGKHPLLTRQEEQALGVMIRAGREAAAELEALRPGAGAAERERLRARVAGGASASERFVQANLRLVVSVAKRYTQASGLSLLDLIQEGNVGLMQAAERFDERRGFRFSTYGTWWIRQAISRAIANLGRTIRLPAQAGALHARVRRAEATFESAHGRSPTPGEVADEAGVTPAKVEEALAFPTEMLSISQPVASESGGELGDMLPDRAPSAFDVVARDMLPGQVRRLLDQLGERERRVVCLRYGLDRGRPRTLEEVGRIFRLSREQIRQIEHRALAKLRHGSGQSEARELLAG